MSVFLWRTGARENKWTGANSSSTLLSIRRLFYGRTSQTTSASFNRSSGSHFVHYRRSWMFYGFFRCQKQKKPGNVEQSRNLVIDALNRPDLKNEPTNNSGISYTSWFTVSRCSVDQGWARFERWTRDAHQPSPLFPIVTFEWDCS